MTENRRETLLLLGGTLAWWAIPLGIIALLLTGNGSFIGWAFEWTLAALTLACIFGPAIAALVEPVPLRERLAGAGAWLVFLALGVFVTWVLMPDMPPTPSWVFD